jgi:mRNA interferase HigB
MSDGRGRGDRRRPGRGAATAGVRRAEDGRAGPYGSLDLSQFAIILRMDRPRRTKVIMRAIAKSHLRRFWESRRGDSDVAEKDLSTWYKLAEHADWAHFGALKQTFGSADQVGHCAVFDVGNNRFRLIGRVFYASGKLYVLKVMDHEEYDKNRWADECRCHEPPPRKASAAKGPASRRRRHRAGGKEGGK